MKEVVIYSGIPYYEIKDYFEKAAMWLSPEKYLGEQWQVELEVLEDQGYKNLPIPQTRLTFTGKAEAVDRAVHKYRRAFLRGGA
ncbi:hypothetical protein [Isachenkonia alkalipeptolytica]|uniref:Molybdopterin cofactor biosynthesis MoaD-related C-terminal domain-containing protein n=1 Tax=Isachenkonia alkalipeptolytica TaxID=2565777 RepID=A0AA43XL17_9CLOT|nr:hypothetical protein [Isachenkonia alkalipeptolytica]NBG88582.1 hypothetical protein [Isachenkonia alkalipeptolytica]